MTDKKNAKRILALVAIVATLFVMLFSTLFLSENVHHNCCGEDCPICAVMAECSSSLKLLGTAVILAAACFIFFESKEDSFTEGDSILVPSSLISQKVRLNN